MQFIYRWTLLGAFAGAAIVMMLATSAFADSYDSSYTNNTNQSVDVSLSGSQEVPSVSTNTTGRFWSREENGTMPYRIDAYNGIQITAAHLHCGASGENGPVIVTLFSDASGRDVNGELARGTITDSSIMDANCSSVIGYSIDTVGDLKHAIDEGDIYANIHSEQYPNGIARGQLSFMDSSHDDGNNHDSHWRDNAEKYWWNNTWWYKNSDGNWYDDHDNTRDGNRDNHDYTNEHKNDYNDRYWWDNKWWNKHSDSSWYDDNGNRWNNRDDHRNDHQWKDSWYNNRGNNDEHSYDRNGKDGRGGRDGRDGHDWKNGNRNNSGGSASASASIYNYVNARSSIR